MDLIEALNVIQKTCRTVKGTCEKCPLRSYDDNCYITETYPENWTFKGEDIPPRVFA